jgi:hypothetical protein
MALVAAAIGASIPSMDCPELARLKRSYESAVRRWGHVLLQDAKLINGPVFAGSALGESFRERDEAKARLVAHRDSCFWCGAKLPARLM